MRCRRRQRSLRGGSHCQKWRMRHRPRDEKLLYITDTGSPKKTLAARALTKWWDCAIVMVMCIKWIVNGPCRSDREA